MIRCICVISSLIFSLGLTLTNENFGNGWYIRQTDETPVVRHSLGSDKVRSSGVPLKDCGVLFSLQTGRGSPRWGDNKVEIEGLRGKGTTKLNSVVD